MQKKPRHLIKELKTVRDFINKTIKRDNIH